MMKKPTNSPRPEAKPQSRSRPPVRRTYLPMNLKEFLAAVATKGSDTDDL